MSTPLEENSTLIAEAQELVKNLPDASGGTDISLGVTGASVGDIIKVKQVDADGKPTAWEAAESSMKLIHEQEITETDVQAIEYTNLDNYNEIMLVLYTPYCTNANNTGATYINGVQWTKDWYGIQAGNLDMYNAIYMKRVTDNIYQCIELSNVNMYRATENHRVMFNLYDNTVSSLKLQLNAALLSRTNASGTTFYPKSWLYAR